MNSIEVVQQDKNVMIYKSYESDGHITHTKININDVPRMVACIKQQMLLSLNTGRMEKTIRYLKESNMKIMFFPREILLYPIRLDYILARRKKMILTLTDEELGKIISLLEKTIVCYNKNIRI